MARCLLRRYLAHPPTCLVCAYGGAPSGCTMPREQSLTCERGRDAGSGSMWTREPTAFIGPATETLQWSEISILGCQLNSRGRECTYLVQTASQLSPRPPAQRLSPLLHPSHPPLRDLQSELTRRARLPHRAVRSTSESPRAEFATSCLAKALLPRARPNPALMPLTPKCLAYFHVKRYQMMTT
jgi:hypothetical protein